MKKIKILFAVLVILTLATVFGYRIYKNSQHFETTEFLFDTVCNITVHSKSDSKAVEMAFEEAAKINKAADFFSEESDVARINRAASDEPVTVSTAVIEMIEIADMVWEKSDGAFDITLAPVSCLWKFDNENPIPPTEEEISAALKLAGRERIKIDKKACTVTKKYSQTKIDMGAVAKGYAADCAAKVLKKQGVKSAIVDFGGNIVVIGKNPGKRDGKWRIGLQTPFAHMGEYSKILEVESGAVVTSGNYQRFFEYGGDIYHHIIDPKTGKPSKQSFDSVTATAESSALADCVATAAYVLGKEKGNALARELGVNLEFLQRR